MPGHILASDRSRYIGKFSGVSDWHSLSVFFHRLPIWSHGFNPKAFSGLFHGLT